MRGCPAGAADLQLACVSDGKVGDKKLQLVMCWSAATLIC